MNDTGVVTYEVNGFLNRVMLERATPAFVHNQFAQVKDLPTNNTDTIKFRRFSNLIPATTPLVQGVTPAGSKLTPTDITTQVKQYGDYLELTDWLDLTTLDPLATENAGILGDQAGETLDNLMRDTLAAGTNVLYASTAVSRVTVAAGMKLGGAEGKTAVRILKNNKAKRITTMINPSSGYNTTPINAAYIGFVHPDTTFDLKAITDGSFVPVQKYGNPAIALPNEIGALDEIRMIESPIAKTFAGAGASGINVYATIVIGMYSHAMSRISGNALQNIIKQVGSAGAADPLNQRGTQGWKASFAGTRLNEAWLIRIEHATTFS